MKKQNVFLLHLIVWISVFLFRVHETAISTFVNELLSNSSITPELRLKEYPFTNSWVIWSSFIQTLSLAIPFYFAFFLTPYYYKNKIKAKKIALITIAAVFIIILSLHISIYGITIKTYRFIFYFAIVIAILVLGVGFRSIFGWLGQKQIQDKLEKQNLRSELNLLQSQLNPHFLFNTLHNIDVLIKHDNEKASASIEQLSDIMRYMLKDAKSDFVDLYKEINYIESYLSLEKLRLNNKMFLNYSISGDYTGLKIAPMIIIPFVENAFKHSVDSSIENGLTVKIAIEKSRLIFNCENQYDKSEVDKDKTHGIGLETVQKRLDLIYKNKHKLIINSENPLFKVNLELELNEN